MIVLMTSSEFASAQTIDFDYISEYAERGRDTALVLLDEVKPLIDFDSENDVAFEYMLVKYKYYFATYDRDMFTQILEDAKPNREASINDTLKLWHEFYRITEEGFKDANIKEKIDASNEEAKRLKIPEIEVMATIFKAKFFRRHLEVDSVFYYSDKALTLALQNNLQIRAAEIYTLLANELHSGTKLKKAIEFYEKAEVIYREEGYDFQLAMVLSWKGGLYRVKGLYGESIKLLQQALDLNKALHSNFRIARVHRQIGHIYKSINDYENAIKRFQEAKGFITEEEHPYLYARINHDIGNMYRLHGDYAQAEAYLTASIASKIKIQDITLTNSHNALGNLRLKERKLDEAEEQFQKAIDLSAKFGNLRYIDETYLGLAKVYQGQGDLGKARLSGKEGLELSQKFENVEVEYNILAFLSEVAVKTGDSKKANSYYQQLFILQDSVMNFKKALKVSSIMTDYENQKKELEILNLKFENQEKERTIRRNKLRSKFYQLALFSFLVSLLIFVVSFIKIKKANEVQRSLNISVNESNENLLRSNKQLEHFAHIASHDLKIPLTSVIGFSSLLEKRLADKLDPEEQEFLNFIITGGKDLSEMINDMLSYAKVGGQEIETKLVDVGIMIKDVMVAMSNSASQKSIVILTHSVFPAIEVDVVKLRRVFQNIISNAIKFADMKKDERFVELSYTELEEMHRFSILDNGIGIPASNKNIFDPFTSLYLKKDYDGTGMGLAICENIIDKHGGKIWYDSELGKGTTFHFTIKK